MASLREGIASFLATNPGEHMIADVETRDRQSMDQEAADELALAKQVAVGDESAVNTLYERHADPLFAFIYHHLEGARPEAEEIWQDTLAAAIRALPTYRGQCRLFSWLCSIARHKIADYFRQRNRTQRHLCLVSPEDLDQLMDGGTWSDEVVNRRATCLRVVEALAGMPVEYRTALAARYADGNSVEEVARLLGKSYKATESLLSRAREAFRATLSQQPEVES